VEVVRSKHTAAAAAERLANVVGPGSLAAADVRRASLRRAASAGPPFDARHAHDAAFTRGDCTTGWQHSTWVGPWQLARSLAALDARVGRASPLRARSVPGARPTLVERAAAAAGARRAEKERATAQRREWAAAYGPEGAAAMEAAAAAAAARSAREGSPGGSRHAAVAREAPQGCGGAVRAAPRAPPRGRRGRDALVGDARGVLDLPGLGLLPDD
jgi:hypothetical protein